MARAGRGAPDFVVNCPGDRTLVMNSLCGQAIRLVFPGGDLPVTPLDGRSLVIITVGRSAAGCAAPDPAVPRACATVLGNTPAALAGSEVLIDPNGWLRSQQPDDAAPAVLADLVRDIYAHPLAKPPKVPPP